MSKRSVIGLTYTINILRQQGIEVDSVLEKHGIRQDALDPMAFIDRDEELAILHDLAISSHDPGLGMKVGAKIHFTAYGPLGMLLMSCRDVMQCIHTGIRYQPLTYLFADLSFVPGQKESALCLNHHNLPEVTRQFLLDRDASGTFKMIKDVEAYIGLKIQPVAVELCSAAPKDVRPLEEYYGCTPVFEMPQTRFVVSNDQLHQPFPQANETVFRLYELQCEKLLKELQGEKETKLSKRVADHLHLFRNDFPTAEQVASVMGISERSLRRNLSAEGTSFQQLMDQCRYDKAQHYLRHSNDSIEVIAQRLGYVEAASFIRAFQRWSGQTPARFRKQA